MRTLEQSVAMASLPTSSAAERATCSPDAPAHPLTKRTGIVVVVVSWASMIRLTVLWVVPQIAAAPR